MTRTLPTTMAVALALALPSATALSQHDKHIKLHVNPRWDECAFQLDSSLTQAAWRQFTREAGIVTYFRPLADARPMGAGKFEFSLLQWNTGIKDSDAAWNDTFVHPDSTHWLLEGSGLQFPGLMARAGVTDKIDVGAYFTKNMASNYGFYGGQVQYNVVNDTSSNWAASARMSFVSMYGPADLDFTSYGADVIASRTYSLASWASVSPYAGVSTYLARSHEKTAVVNLSDENTFGAQATLGAVVRLSRAKVALEYGASRVNSHAMKIGVSF